MGRGLRGAAALTALMLLLAPVPARGAADSVRNDSSGESYGSVAAAIAAARPGDTVRVGPGTYREHLTIDKPLRLLGSGGPLLDGGGEGSIVTVDAPDVTVQGFRLQGTGDNLEQENTAIAVNAPRALIRDNQISDALFGIYLRQATDSRVEGNSVRGKDLPQGEKGDPIKAWYSHRIAVTGNSVDDGRDSILWYTDDCLVADNRITNSRYGLHFMFSSGCRVEGNVLQFNSVGAYVMYGSGITFKENGFLDNRGPSGYGIGLKEVNSVTAEGNWFVRNRVAVYADTTPLDPGSVNRFHLNMIVGNDIGLYLLPSVHDNLFWENSFVDNQEQVAEGGSGRIVGNTWTVDGRGNHWSDYTGYDARGDGLGDMPYQDKSAFAFLADHNARLRWFIYSPAASAVDLAASAFPVLTVPAKVTDTAPLLQPQLPPGYRPAASADRRSLLLVALAMLGTAGGVLALIFRRQTRRDTAVCLAWEGRQP